MRGPSRLVCLAGLLAGCLPNEVPYWLIDHPVAWGIKIGVTRPGGYASGLIVPEGRVRARALPLDTIELEWLTLAPKGVELAPPIWIVCSFPFTCRDFISMGLDETGLDELPACEHPVPIRQYWPCRLGEGHRLSLVLDGAVGGSAFGALPVMAIGSADPELSPETCLQRLMAEPKLGLESCLLIDRDYHIGSLAPPTGLPDPSGPFDPPMPDDPMVPEAPIQVADTHPTVEGFWVSAPGGEVFVPVGGEVVVRPGAAVSVAPILAQDAQQEYFRPVTTGPDGYLWVPEEELVLFRAAASGWVEQWEYLEDERSLRFVVPEGLGPFDLHFYIADTRDGRTTVALRLVPEGMSETP
jgi:hypothetical protein